MAQFNKLKEAFQQYKYFVIGASVLFLLASGWLIQTIFSGPSRSNSDLVPTLSTTEITDTTKEANKGEQSESKASETIYVDIKGAVKIPGMYKAQASMRAFDIIELAGGLLPEADVNQVNLALKITDQMVLYIPKKGEKVSEQMIEPGNSTASQKADSSNSGKININTADKEELTKIAGVGDKKAEDIIRYREENGSFKKVEELMNVSGIGQKTFERIENMVTIE